MHGWQQWICGEVRKDKRAESDRGDLGRYKRPDSGGEYLRVLLMREYEKAENEIILLRKGIGSEEGRLMASWKKFKAKKRSKGKRKKPR